MPRRPRCREKPTETAKLLTKMGRQSVDQTCTGRFAYRRLLLLMVETLLVLPLSTSALQCLGQKGQPVDWFIVYKMPMFRHMQGTEFGEGLAQYYLDGQNTQWQLSPRPVNETGHAIYYTLQQIYAAQNNSILYLMFNDANPAGHRSRNHGHAKGTLAFDNHSGFWLIHSAPQFPPKQKDGYRWAYNACEYGQTFLCVSFAYKSLDELARQLLYYYPRVYDHYLPPATLKVFPHLAYLVNSTRIHHPPYFSVSSNLASLAGMPLTNFAKFTYFGADLYDALVAPTLKTGLLVETWQHAAPSVVLPNNCSAEYKVYNVKEVALPGDHLFKETKDHSKYAISLTSDGWVCVGGINRDLTQFKRAGGTMCFQNQEVWKTFQSTITVFAACPRH